MIAAPTIPTVALPVGVRFDVSYPNYPGAIDVNSSGNIAGLPAISIPNGFGDHGLPTGLSTDVHTRRPPLV